MIIVFYSFKGGSGRTMALANTAVALARAQKKVLAVDFDLESPSLGQFFQVIRPHLDDEEGVIDMLTKQLRCESGQLSDWREFVVPINFLGGSISLITSGKLDSGYPGRVLEFNWKGFYGQANGSSFIEWLKTQWGEYYDVVLIDSHAGISTSASVCTIALSDLIIPVVVAGSMSVEGTVDVLRRTQRARQKFDYDRYPALILPLLSRLDVRGERGELDRWLDMLSNRFSVFYDDWLPPSIPPRVILEKTMLPHVTTLGFGEKLATLDGPSSDQKPFIDAIEEVAKLIGSNLRVATVINRGTP